MLNWHTWHHYLSSCISWWCQINKVMTVNRRLIKLLILIMFLTIITLIIVLTLLGAPQSQSQSCKNWGGRINGRIEWLAGFPSGTTSRLLRTKRCFLTYCPRMWLVPGLQPEMPDSVKLLLRDAKYLGIHTDSLWKSINWRFLYQNFIKIGQVV